MERHNTPQGLRRPVIEGVKYGLIAGFIATWSISTAIAASELELGLPISTFYAIMGISLGSIDFTTSAYLGFGLHLLTGTILGGVFGGIAVRYELQKNIANIFSPYKSIVMGIGTGVLIWLILFLTITALIIGPSIGRIVEILSSNQENIILFVFESNNIEQSFRGISISAIAFHVVWGAIFGFIISSLLRIRFSSLLSTSSASATTKMQYRHFIGSPVRTLSFGLVAGLISSLPISGMILLVEKVSSLPLGTFYYVLVSALTGSSSGNTEVVVATGLAMHLLAGSFIGLVMSIPLIVSRKTHGDTINKRRRRMMMLSSSFLQKYSPVYGLAFGFGLWLVVFLPITFMMIIPLLNSFENQDIILRQRVPTGEVASTTFFELLSIMDRIIYGAIAFNIFYGLVTAILLQSFSQKYLLADKKNEKQGQSKETMQSWQDT